jgi:hypothetical protein
MPDVKAINVTPRVCVEIAKNYAMKIPAIRSFRTKLRRTSGAPLKENLHRYVYDLVEKVERVANGVKDKSILEIGPGDHLATGLAMLALGAKSYSALDRFSGDYEGESSQQWYRLLKQNWKFPNWSEQVDINDFLSSGKVNIYKTSVENFNPKEKFDIVCSYAVGEHLSDIRSFAELNKKSIKNGGVGIHCIDFGGHQWDRYGDPFLFLKFPDLVWNLMGSARGEPNRVRFAPYLRFFEEAGLQVSTSDIKYFAYDSDDEWVSNRMDDSFLVQEATFILKS